MESLTRRALVEPVEPVEIRSSALVELVALVVPQQEPRIA